MNTDNGRLFYATGIDNSQLRSDAAESRNILASIGQTATQEGANIDAMFGKIAKASAGIFATSQLVEFSKQVINVRGEIQSLETSFETLAGQKGIDLFKEIKDFATSTPMMMKDLASGAQTMLAFNIEAQNVMPILRAIGDISMGDAQKFNSLTLAFSQMSATGKLMGQDLLQMISAGFNPLSVISEKTGKSIGELREEMEQGKITTQMVTEAFMSATSEGGKFYEMLVKQSHGIKGAISNFEGAIDDALNDMGASVQDTTIGIINTGTYLVQHYDTILDIVGVLVATYGTYRAALIVNAAVEQMMAKASAERIALIEAEISAVGVKTAQEQLATDADIAAAVSKGNLTEAEGLHILALKKEAAARVESLALAAKQAAAELAAATAARQNAGVRLQAAEANATAMRIEYEAALAKGEVFEIALAKERMETAQTEINTASQQYQAAATAEATAAKTAQTAQTTANSAAQQLNNIQVQQGTVQTGIFATAVRMLTNTLKALWATMMKHPGALILAAVVALGAAIYNVTKKTKELSAEQQILDDVTGQATAKVADEKTKIETLSGIVHDNTKKLEERKTALLALQEIVPDYHAALTAEGNLINDNTDALNRYIDALLKAAKLEAIKGGITETFKELTNLAMDVKNDRSDYGAFLNFFTSDQNIEKNKKQWTAWYNDFIKDPSKYTRKGQGGRTEVLMGSGLSAQWLHADMGEDWISESERDLIKAAGKYAEFSRLYKNILAEDVTTNSKPSTAPKRYKNEVAEQRKALADAQAEVKRLEASATATTAEVKNAQQKVETAKKKLKELGINVERENKAGDRAANVRQDNANTLAAEAAERMRQSEEYARRMADQEKDNEFEIRQARIDAMKDGIDKELIQNKLNFDRLEEQNKRRLREMLDAVAEERLRQMEDKNPTIFKKKDSNGKLEDDPGKRDEALRTIRLSLTVEDLTPAQKQQFEEFGKIAATAFETANQESMEHLLGDFLNYQQKRTQMAEEWERIRSFIPVEYGQEANKKMLQQFSELDFEHIKEQFNWEAVFSNFETMSSATLEKLIRQLKSYRGIIEETYDPKIISEYNAALRKLQTAQRANDKNLWSVFVPAAFQERIEAEETLKELQEEYNNLLDKQKQKEEEIEKKVQEIAALIKQLTGEDMPLGDIMNPQKLQTTIDSLKKTNPDGSNQLKGLSDDLQGMQTQLGGITSAAGEAGSAIAGMAGGGGGGAMQTLNMVGAIVHAINDSVQSAKELVDDLANTADALGADTEVGSGWDTAKTFMGGFAEASQGATEAFESFKSGNPMGVIQGVVKSFTAWIRCFAAIKDAKHERTIQKLQDKIEDLEDAYKRLDRAIDKAFSKDASKLLNQQAEMIEQQRQLIKMQIEEEKAKKNTDWDKIKDWETQLKDLEEDYEDAKEKAVDAIFGEDIKSAIEDFADAYADAWAKGEDRSKSARDVVKQMMQNMVKESIKAAIQSSGAMERIRAKLQQFYADNVLSDWEQDYVLKMAESLQEELDKQFGWANNLLSGDDDKEREASQKGIATADQDSIDELNGRATAIQNHTFSINENTKTILATTQAILRSVMNIESETNGLGSRIEKMEGNIKEMADTLDDIATKGIRLKD